jgi:hypothetical protein
MGSYCSHEKARLLLIESIALETCDSSPAASATRQDAEFADWAGRAWQSYWFKFSPRP